jgi:hypothetical protein
MWEWQQWEGARGLLRVVKFESERSVFGLRSDQLANVLQDF